MRYNFELTFTLRKQYLEADIIIYVACILISLQMSKALDSYFMLPIILIIISFLFFIINPLPKSNATLTDIKLLPQNLYVP